jgi:hypothetical protein
MASPSESLPQKPRSFDPPEEPVWHRMIAEAAYRLAEKRGFVGEHSLDDWLAAEQQVRQMLSSNPESEATMDASQKRPESSAKSVSGTTEQPTGAKDQGGSRTQGPSRFEKFAATQAAGDGIQGDALKKGQTVEEKIGANMADRK